MKPEDKIGIEDEIGSSIEQKQREQLTNELASYKEALDDNIKLKARHQRQVERDRKLFELRLKDENFRRIDPVFKYEELDAYWELIRDVLQDEFEHSMQLGEGKQDSIQHQIEHLERNIVQLEETITGLDSEEENE